VECSRRAYKELKKVGAKVEYFEIPSGKHGINFHVYNQPDFMDWLFRQRNRADRETHLPAIVHTTVKSSSLRQETACSTGIWSLR
jgi:hypothetical protein